MEDTVRTIEYLYATVGDRPGEARRLLDRGATGIMSDDPALVAPIFDDFR